MSSSSTAISSAKNKRSSKIPFYKTINVKQAAPPSSPLYYLEWISATAILAYFLFVDGPRVAAELRGQCLDTPQCARYLQLKPNGVVELPPSVVITPIQIREAAIAGLLAPILQFPQDNQIRRDDGDIQWREIKKSLPILLLVAAIFSFFFRVSKRNKHVLLFLGCGFVLYLHGILGFLYVLFLYTVFYSVVRAEWNRFPRVFSWAFAVFVFVLRDWNTISGYLDAKMVEMVLGPFEAVRIAVVTGAKSTKLPMLTGPLDVHVTCRFIVIKLLSFGIDYARRKDEIAKEIENNRNEPVVRDVELAAAGGGSENLNHVEQSPDGSRAVRDGVRHRSGSTARKNNYANPASQTTTSPRSPNSKTSMTNSAASTSPSTFSYSNLLTYVFYPPLYIAGPLIGYDEFLKNASIISTTTITADGHAKPAAEIIPVSAAVKYFFRKFLPCYILLEFFLHFMPVYAIIRSEFLIPKWLTGATLEPPVETKLLSSSSDTTKSTDSTQSVGMKLHQSDATDTSYLAVKMIYWILCVLWLKFATLWRFFRFWTLLMGIDCVENMQNGCFNNNTTLQGFWQGWHCSFNKWLIRYIYLPLGGRERKFTNVWVIFFFVAVWHDLEKQYLVWGLLNAGFLMFEFLVSGMWIGKMEKEYRKVYQDYDLGSAAEEGELETLSSRKRQNPVNQISSATTRFWTHPIVSYHFPNYVNAAWGFVLVFVNGSGYGAGLGATVNIFRDALSGKSQKLVAAMCMQYVFFVATAYVMRRHQELRYENYKRGSSSGGEVRLGNVAGGGGKGNLMMK
ncbi:unnamed protein product [Amoebophrya sp. A120]|nr:unnamed protein product [Amoebophrya sp. A120]|eukprot:GSA120T00022430001.1